MRVGKAGASFPPGTGTVGTHFDPATPFLGIYPEETVQIPGKDLATGTLFVVAENYSQP